MKVVKSSRHHKIIGDYGENLVCNLLSRSGFEVTIVDHTGIDILAYSQGTGRRLGLSVKSRTRDAAHQADSVNLLKKQKSKDDRKLLLDACTAFAAEPWFAIYVECATEADLFLLP